MEPKKQTVLIVHNRYQIRGGEDTVVENEARLLEEHGHRVILYLRDNAELRRYGFFRKLLFPFAALSNPRTKREIGRILAREKVDLVHVHNTLPLVSPSVYRAARAAGVPVLQTVHNFRLLCPGATFYRDGEICEDCVTKGLSCAVKHRCYRGSRLQTALSARILRRNRKIYRTLFYLCLTEFTKEKLTALVSPERIFVKPNFTYDAGGKDGVGEYYLFVGRLEESKGVSLLVEAFAGTARSLKIVGDGPLADRIAARIADCPNIELLGRKDRAEVNALMKGAKALVMCSQWYETFGMVVIEAYANGTPVLVGDLGNVRLLVEEGKTGFLFSYRSAAALRDAADRLEHSDIAAMGQAAYRVYRERYAPEVNYLQLKEIYDAIAP